MSEQVYAPLFGIKDIAELVGKKIKIEGSKSKMIMQHMMVMSPFNETDHDYLDPTQGQYLGQLVVYYPKGSLQGGFPRGARLLIYGSLQLMSSDQHKEYYINMDKMELLSDD